MRTDSSCQLIDQFGPCSGDAKCVVVDDQYKQSPCNHYKPSCEKLERLYSVEDSIKDQRSAYRRQIDFSKISRDPWDIKIFLWAKRVDDVCVFTCDSNLLEICCKFDIPRICFKAAMKQLDQWLAGAIFNGNGYKTEWMSTDNDPYVNSANNSKCLSHCRNSENCNCS